MSAEPRQETAQPGATTRIRAFVLALAVGLVLADSSVAVLALPAIYRELDVELGDLHWVLTAFNLALAVAAVPAARLLRRTSPARACGVGLACFAIASAGCAASSSYGALLAFRAVQALAGATVLVAALGLLPVLVGSDRRAVEVWVAAGAVGAAIGPAVGGALTETISWQAVFAVQVPLALGPLPFLAGLPRPAPRSGPAGRPHVAPNVALALLSAGLAAALFLVVLLLIEGWHLSPIAAAAVVSALPLAAIATALLARRTATAGARGAAGAVLVGGGLAALALLPHAGWAWTVPPQVLVGAGLALALSALTERAIADREPQALHGGVTIAARHAGVVIGLVLLTPILVGDLNRQRDAAEQDGVSRLLDAPLPVRTKLELARALGDRLEQTDARIPELGPAFQSVELEPAERPAVADLEHALDDVLDRAVTSAFTRAFLVAAALALLALVPIAAGARSRA